MRAHEGKTSARVCKTSARVYDYADLRVPVLRAMHARRPTTNKALGFIRDQEALAAARCAGAGAGPYKRLA